MQTPIPYSGDTLLHLQQPQGHFSFCEVSPPFDPDYYQPASFLGTHCHNNELVDLQKTFCLGWQDTLETNHEVLRVGMLVSHHPFQYIFHANAEHSPLYPVCTPVQVVCHFITPTVGTQCWGILVPSHDFPCANESWTLLRIPQIEHLRPTL